MTTKLEQAASDEVLAGDRLAGNFNGWVAAFMPVERRRSSHPQEAAATAPSARRTSPLLQPG